MPTVSDLLPYALYVIVSRWTTPGDDSEAIQWDIAWYNPAPGIGLKLFRDRPCSDGYWHYRLDFDPASEHVDHLGRAAVIMLIGEPRLTWPFDLASVIETQDPRPTGSLVSNGRLCEDAFADGDKYMVKLVLTLYKNDYLRARYTLDEAVINAIGGNRPPPCRWIDAVDW
ncbi:hypothetical protein CALCODRAFT_502819 [Calocera cornea HHB12733]|uniref:Uncharacterized protein n=1 Tax=Calocera cornea HHB12733 TaxID=1353952 RepID=A0A165D4A2_9BASI|nr:hypothetical protein CALCODRAFT_502819 [Calocera cornea HHB12733]